MTMVLQNRTISMILTFPDVKESVSPLSQSVEDLEQTAFAFAKNRKPATIPIYHGSIIRIEQHRDNENASDLIVRVPNFYHLSLPSLSISSMPTSDEHLNETESQKEARMKRPAPICPILNGSRDQSPSTNQNETNEFDNSNQKQSETHSRLINTKRLTVGLRNISRVLTANFKSKQSSNINEVTIVPVLPDVEIITEKIEIQTTPKKPTKNQNSTSKFIPPKLLFIKRKHFKIKKKQAPTKSTDIETENKDSTIENSSKEITLKDNEIEQQNESIKPTPIKINNNIEQQSETIEKSVPNIPILVIDKEHSSTHCYCTIPQSPSDPPTTITDDIPSSIEPPKTILQNRTFISEEKINLITDLQPFIHIDNEPIHDYDTNIDERLYVVHPNGDTYSETYEVTYELDPEYQNHLNNENEQIYLPKTEEESLINFNSDPFKSQDLSTAITAWLPSLPKMIPNNNYSEIEDDNINQPFQKSQGNIDVEHSKTNPKESELTITNVARVKFQSVEDISQISNDPSSTDQAESASAFSSSPENDQVVCLNDTSVVDEEYTIILQLLKRVLQMDTNTNNDDNEFNKQISQKFQTNTMNECEQK